jgi:amidase
MNKGLTISQVEEEKFVLSTSMLKQWLDSGIDALLMPVIPWVGYRPKEWVQSNQWVGYTAMWNLLNYASVTVPVTKADRALDGVDGGKDAEWEGHHARNESDAYNHSQCECPL